VGTMRWAGKGKIVETCQKLAVESTVEL
jgi:hypothetical protein